MSDEPYVNWEVSPEGCNAVYKYYLNGDGVSCRKGGWERWDWSNLQVFKWNGDEWEWLNGQWVTNHQHRIFRPEEEIVSAKRKNVSKDFSKMPEGTRVVEPVDMYQVHNYIRDNLKIETVRLESFKWEMQLSLAGEVISKTVL